MSTWITAYGYDDNNRTSKVVTGGSNGGTTGYNYNALNQLTQYSDKPGNRHDQHGVASKLTPKERADLVECL